MELLNKLRVGVKMGLFEGKVLDSTTIVADIYISLKSKFVLPMSLQSDHMSGKIGCRTWFSFPTNRAHPVLSNY